MKKANRSGFTIVELVIVIAIIAILVAVLIPTFSALTTRAKESAALQEARNAFLEYKSGKDPDSLTLIIQRGDYFFTVINGEFSSSPKTSLADAKALFDTVANWSEKTENGFYFPVTEPPKTEGSSDSTDGEITTAKPEEPTDPEDPLDSIDDEITTQTPDEPIDPEENLSWQDKFVGGYEEFFATTINDGITPFYYAYLTLNHMHNTENAKNTEEIASYFGIKGRVIYPSEFGDPEIADSVIHQDLVVYATRAELATLAQSSYITGIYPFYGNSIRATKFYSTTLPDGDDGITLTAEMLNELWEMAANKEKKENAEETPLFVFETAAQMEDFVTSLERLFSVSPVKLFPYFEGGTYDDAFFEENSLLLVLMIYHTKATAFNLHDIRRKNNQIIIYLDHIPRPVQADTSFFSWSLVEAPKTQLVEVDDWSAVVR